MKLKLLLALTMLVGSAFASPLITSPFDWAYANAELDGQSMAAVLSPAPSSAPGTFTYGQLACGHMTSACSGGTDGCTSTNTCPANLAAATTAGQIVIVYEDVSASTTSTAPTETGGASSTWLPIPNCTNAGNANTGWVTGFYTLSDGGGNTTVSANLTTSESNIWTRVITYTKSTTPAYDNSNSELLTGGSDCTNCAAPSLTISGPNDAFVQFGAPANHVTAISGAYTNPDNFESGFGAGGAINQTSYSAPTWTVDTSGDFAGCVLAIK
jgi:hypothetical protein